MNEGKIREQLSQIANENFPNGSIDLWPAVHKTRQNVMIDESTQMVRIPNKSTIRTSYWILVTSAALLLFAGMLWFISPSVRAFAGQILTHYFKQEQDDLRTGEARFYVEDPNEDYSPPVLQSVPGQPGVSITLDVTEPEAASQLPESFTENIPFKVMVPTFVPDNYVLSNTIYYPMGRMTTLIYECTTGEWGFSLDQNQLTYEEFISQPYRAEVGSSAIVELITIWDGVRAEYVKGNWRVIEEPDLTNFKPGETVHLEEVWDPQINYHRLTWYVDGSLFRLYTSLWSPDVNADMGTCPLDREIFVKIAESMK
jgi:hypothetical protein